MQTLNQGGRKPLFLSEHSFCRWEIPLGIIFYTLFLVFTPGVKALEQDDPVSAAEETVARGKVLVHEGKIDDGAVLFRKALDELSRAFEYDAAFRISLSIVRFYSERGMEDQSLFFRSSRACLGHVGKRPSIFLGANAPDHRRESNCNAPPILCLPRR